MSDKGQVSRTCHFLPAVEDVDTVDAAALGDEVDAMCAAATRGRDVDGNPLSLV